MQVHRCPVCQSEAAVPTLVPEMLRGTREKFLYFECSDCGCLSLAEDTHAPEQYDVSTEEDSESRSVLAARRIAVALHLRPSYFQLRRQRRADLEVLRHVRLTKNTALLDVGFRPDTLADALRELGYNATGIDLGVNGGGNESSTTMNHTWLDGATQTFDVILFRHSLERLPVEMLSLARQRIREHGCCVACVALLGWAWRTYKTDWAQLNAPFNRLIHSEESFRLLAQKSGFRIDNVVFDSTELQFWFSDALQRNVPLKDVPGPSRSQRTRMRRIAEALNLGHQGDSAQFYLKPE